MADSETDLVPNAFRLFPWGQRALCTCVKNHIHKLLSLYNNNDNNNNNNNNNNDNNSINDYLPIN